MAVGVVLIAGWWIWKNQQIQDYKADEKYCQKDQDCGCSTCGCLNFYWKDKMECETTYEGAICDEVGCICKDNQCMLLENKYCEKDEDCIFTQCCGCAKECNRKCDIKPEATPCKCENNQCVPTEFKQIVVTTDKTEYEQGETVKITVKNNLDKSIWYYEWSGFTCADSFFLEKREDGEYRYFSIPGLRESPTQPVELKPNLEKVYWLNLSKLKEQCEGFSPEFSAGTYKLGFNYGFTIEEHWSEKAYSNEFRIRKRSEGQTSDWKTYTNKEYGFEIKYPRGNRCKFLQIEEGSFLFGRIGLNVTNSKGLNLDDYVKKFIADNDLALETRETTSVANREGIKLTYRFGGTNRYGEVTFVKNNGNIYAIGYTGGAFLCNEPEIFSKMLSTFRFLE